VKLKEIKFRPRTEVHDLGYKTKHAREFLDKGHRVRLTVQFRGREMAHPEYGQKVLETALGMIGGDYASGPIKMDGRNMFVELRPA
jgi:translation initiation factor IF-3